MELELTRKQFRRLLDMVYIGNWILNSTRGEDRFKDYDEVESLLFSKAAREGMPTLADLYQALGERRVESLSVTVSSLGAVLRALLQT